MDFYSYLTNIILFFTVNRYSGILLSVMKGMTNPTS